MILPGWSPRLRGVVAREYAQGFRHGYAICRWQICTRAHQELTTAAVDEPEVAAWAAAAAERAAETARVFDPDPEPPPAAARYRSPLVRVARAAILRRAAAGTLADRLQAIGRADGMIAGRVLTVRQLVDAARELLPDDTALRLSAATWLDQAAHRWRRIGATGPAPLPHTLAAVMYDALADRGGWCR